MKTNISKAQTKFRSRCNDEFKHKLHKLITAASHSPDDTYNNNSWVSGDSSGSDVEHESEDAVREQLVSANMHPSLEHLTAKQRRGLHSIFDTECSSRDSLEQVVPQRQLTECRSCTCSDASRGPCLQHGSERKCTYHGCKRHVASSGLCRTHGGGRRCQVPDCMSNAQSRGLCYVHGGGGRCQREGCGSSAKKGGFCIAHGGGHRCEVTGCTSSAVSGSRCRAHGGGRRCAVENCTSSAKTGGRCIAHGGGKRCTVNGCTSSAQRLGLCKAHGGGRRCIVDNCANSAVSRSRCIAHGGGKRCVFEGCSTTARRGGFCFAHGGRSTPSIACTRTKLPSPSSTFQTTPASVSPRSLPWSLTKERSIPALTLPPRRLLPPINVMLTANRPGIRRRSSPVPPIRKPVLSFERKDQLSRRSFDESRRSPSQAWHCSKPAYLNFQDRLQTPSPSSTRTGYSWQRLQETIRRESRVHGITNDDDELVTDEKFSSKTIYRSTHGKRQTRNCDPVLL